MKKNIGDGGENIKQKMKWAAKGGKSLCHMEFADGVSPILIIILACSFHFKQLKQCLLVFLSLQVPVGYKTI